jgi:energy-coupling factor transporter ATP-binding protein EcfA2
MVNVVTYAEAERAVVGSAFIDADSIRSALDHCTPDDFTDPTLAAVYDILIGHRSAQLGLDEVCIAKAVNERGYKISPLDLLDLRSATPTSSNVAFYAKIVNEGAVRRKLRAAGSRFVQFADGDDSLSETMRNARGEWDAVQSSVGSHLQAKVLGEVLEGSDEYDWMIPNLLERKDRVVITGGEGAGKTTLVRQIAIMAAAGLHPTLGGQIAPVRVLVVDSENTEKQWRRATRSMALKARMAGTADPAQSLQLACTARIDVTADRDLGSVHRLIDEHAPDLLMIGPLYRLVPRAITNDDDAAPLIAALDTLRDRGVAMIIEAHAGHALGQDGSRNLRPRGSAALLGWPEFGLGISSAGGEDPSEFRMVRWRGDRDERAWPESLRRGGEWPWMDDDPMGTRTKIRRIAQATGEAY